MRIAYIYDAVYPWETGGVQKRVWEVARRLADDHDVHWFGLKYWDGPSVIESDGVVLHGVGPAQDLYVDGRRSIPEVLSYSRQLVRPLFDEQFDIIDCQEFPYFPCFPSKLHSLLRGSTLVMTWHEIWGDYWYEYLGRKGVFGKAIERMAAQVPDGHIAVSNRTRDDAEDLGVSDARLVPNGIDLDAVRSVEPADRDGDVLFAGRFIEQKNPDLVVEAVAELAETDPEINCGLVGGGPEHNAMTALIERLGLEDNVSCPGFIDEHEPVLGLIKAADVLAHPSRREGFGITVLEALACGTPVVTIRNPQNASTELVEDGVTGKICVPSKKEIAEGIQTARVSMSEDDCVATAQEYDWDQIVCQLEETCQTTC
ncbi:glycosyltransferase family 4 protein [Halobacteriaceae archaeon SHR40]|uniref:glycosyltransferase family 4 protein n=1 Tax=Halovenus amylolytica TaxID=2500550 RepID=UPI000FE36BB4